jgi:hypothetical protein
MKRVTAAVILAVMVGGIYAIKDVEFAAGAEPVQVVQQVPEAIVAPAVKLSEARVAVTTEAAPVVVKAVPVVVAKPATPKAVVAPKAKVQVKAPVVPSEPVLPVCDDEDDELLAGGKTVAACYWDAKAHGTGGGTSFIKYSTETGTAFRYLG